jgi:Zn-dependent peptidase ImmA (M78 family)
MAALTRERERAPFNRDVLKWARERVKLSPEAAAQSGGFLLDQIESWEAGTRLPTIKQARKLATVYDLPFMEFLSKERPKVKSLELVPDFRMEREKEEPTEQYDLVLIQSEAEEVRLNAIDLFEMVGSQPPVIAESFYANTGQNAEVAAGSVRGAIGLPISEQFSRKGNDKDKFVAALRSYLERSGIIVMKNSGLANFGARGMCLFASPLPVIIFSSEAPTAQVFTLAHELAHVVLKESGISGPIQSSSTRARAKIVENWCDAFAGAFLMPASEVEGFLGGKPDKPESSIDDGRISLVANAFCVSRHAALVRLVELGYVKSDFYWKVMRHRYLEQEAAYKSGGRPKYYGSRFRSSRGDLYTGLVLEAWSNGAITNHNAGEFMGIKNLTHLEDIRNHFRD